MRLLNVFYGLFGLLNITNAFISYEKNPSIFFNNVINKKNIKNIKLKTTKKLEAVNFKNKIEGFSKLTRPKNIISTFALTFSGGYIMNPSLKQLFENEEFIFSSICTILIVLSSMVINDFYDAEVDKINKPTSPIPSGQITKTEALVFNLILIGITEFLGLRFLKEDEIIFLNLIIFVIQIYTPVLKKIPLVKNITCAAIISLSVFFSGLASNENILITENTNFYILLITTNIIFCGSLVNEILLDIRDVKGDKIYNIPTLPVIFGKTPSLIISYIITNSNIMLNSIFLLYLKNETYALFLILLYSPIMVDLFKIKNKNVSNKVIVNIVNNKKIPMFLILFYMCFLARFS